MQIFKSVAVIVLCLSWTTCLALYLPGQRQQTNQQRRLQSTRNDYLPYPANRITEFEYVPTAQGYRYGYVLNDGTVKAQGVIVKGAPYDMRYAEVDAVNTGFNAVGIGGRPKNRKLSPKSLQSLAG